MKVVLTLSFEEAKEVYVALMSAKEYHARRVAVGDIGAPGTALRAGNDARAVRLPLLMYRVAEAIAVAVRQQQ